MIHEGIALAEYADFYDYSSSYPDAENEDVNVEDEVNFFYQEIVHKFHLNSF